MIGIEDISTNSKLLFYTTFVSYISIRTLMIKNGKRQLKLRYSLSRVKIHEKQLGIEFINQIYKS